MQNYVRKEIFKLATLPLLLLFACKSNLNNDIINVGWVNENGRTACYWIGNERVDLVNSSEGAAYLTDLQFKDSVFYSCGTYSNGERLNGFFAINDSIIYLDGKVKSEIHSIKVVDDTVLLVGFFNSKPAFWKNGNRILLENSDDYSVESMYTFNKNVFISGYNRIEKSVCFWVNGVRVDLNDGRKTYETANNIFVDEYDTLIAGSFIKGELLDKACFWKNGKRIDLAKNLNLYSYANSIYKDNNDIYVAGYFGKIDPNSSTYKKVRQACYWKNGELHTLESENSIAKSIMVKNGRVVIGGFTRTKNKTTPCYWINGKKYDLEPWLIGYEGLSNSLSIISKKYNE
ncbi:hypothetical protein MATR_29960 [Marivirga tractuosa]|uniref:Lipoprotein n=1 Tax=Marivirga tractuosa (strain ATCC 23168 / DSM 4126 / NBRC 15989 / NCIMB 1408 / VKM B-1430 / H-43) TaxID=643867 RepID=E4TV90_MARTH|nr:hypothetical protein [Marivirga tractuosa]ADR23155.1 hypothetical protein Ftrac_3181 [Marivirga tractuosa DSM 4126]BDD16171.1 hypothetical protein MATR_29960 [Marivirga tractuosa]